ncbi:MAG: hypothetical protein HY051_03450 [Candidatus Aenigmarchaeota archaeon]|nr:hypothetical protein [Candidatus Aenigmarchaeota archaeon]
MALNIMEWPGIEYYKLARAEGPKGRNVFLAELASELEIAGLRVEEAMVISRGQESNLHRELKEITRRLGAVYCDGCVECYTENGVNVAIVAVDKPEPLNNSGRYAIFSTFTKPYIGDPVAEYVTGMERLWRTHRDGIRQGDRLIIYQSMLETELREVFDKLGVGFASVGRYNSIRTKI